MFPNSQPMTYYPLETYPLPSQETVPVLSSYTDAAPQAYAGVQSDRGQYLGNYWPQEYSSSQSAPQDRVYPIAVDLPLHAPVPRQYSVLPQADESQSIYYRHAADQALHHHAPHSPPLKESSTASSQALSPSAATSDDDPFSQFCAAWGKSENLLTFPTPSQLLSTQSSATESPPKHPPSPIHSSPTQSTSKHSSPSSSTQLSPSRSKAGSRAYPSTGKAESARTARRRDMARSVGFMPTDPDTISSHEKKRHYLECLEHYIVYLHEQLNIVGAPPVAIERVSSYRGLSSRSIRTLLVHMENLTRKLNMQRVEEERRFLILRDNLLKQQAAAEAFRQFQAAPPGMPDQSSYYHV